MKEDLTVGYTFKNCKEVGKWLGKDIPDKLRENTRNSWLKELDTYCTWHKDGQKIIVDEVFSQQKEKVDGRRGNTRHRKSDKYGTLMDDIILEHLILNSGTMCDSVYSFASEFNITTKEYQDASLNGGKSYKSKLGLEKHGVIDCYTDKAMETIRYQFEASLKRLSKRGIITYNKTFMVARNDKDNSYQPLECEEDIEILNETIKKVELLTGIDRFKRKNKEVNKQFKRDVINLLGEPYNENFYAMFGFYKAYNIQLEVNEDDIEEIDLEKTTKEFINILLMNIHEKVMAKEINIKKESKWGSDKISTIMPYQYEKNIGAMAKMDILFFGQKCSDDNIFFLLHELGSPDSVEILNKDIPF